MYMTSQPVPGFVDMSAREQSQYNLLRAITSLADGTMGRKGGIEREASEAISQRLGRPSRGLFVPMNLPVQVTSTRASVTGNVVGTATLGGNAVETQIVGFEQLLRNRMMVRALGATVMTGLTGNVAIPRQITANTLEWTGENPSSGNALTEMTIDLVSLSPKTAMTSTAYSRQTAVQATPAIANLALNDLATVCAVGLDYAAINGTGLNNQPKGIRAQAGINTKAVGTDGGPLTWSFLAGFETEAALDNADVAGAAWLTTPGVRGHAKTTLKSTVAGAGFLWDADNTMAGYRAFISNQVPKNLTKGTSTTICHAAIFGDWPQLLIGEWSGAVDLLVNPFSYASQGMISVHAYMMADVAVRQPTAFVVCEDIVVP